MAVIPTTDATAYVTGKPSRANEGAMLLFKWSRRVARRIERVVLGSYSIETTYRDAIRSSMGRGSLVLDAGAGSRCIYARDDLNIVGSDISSNDLTRNLDIQFAVVSDLGGSLPFPPNSLDAVTACYFVEHLQDSENFIRNVASILRPGGKLFLLFPCRYAPFAVLNRIISNKFTVKMLRLFVEGSQGGFPAIYNNCWPKRMREVLNRNGLAVVRTEVCFYQSHYYASFLPVYLCSVLYDMLVKAFNIESMAASACMFAEKVKHSEPPTNAGYTG